MELKLASIPVVCFGPVFLDKLLLTLHTVLTELIQPNSSSQGKILHANFIVGVASWAWVKKLLPNQN